MEARNESGELMIFRDLRWARISECQVTSRARAPPVIGKYIPRDR